MPELKYISCILPGAKKQTPHHGPDRAGNWHGNYRGPNFDYKFNEYGFRGPQLERDTPALASFGPSFSVGVGIPVELRFCDLVAKKHNLTNFSFASTGGDNLAIMRNINSFFNSSCENIDVKLLVVMWADCARFSYAVPTKDDYVRVTRGPGWIDEMTKEEQNHMIYWSQNCSELHLLEHVRTVDLLAKLHNIPVIQVSTNFVKINFDIKSFYSKPVWYESNQMRDFIAWKDFGRDNHPGIKTHQSVANIINAIIKNNILALSK
jgi:hypothetical protein